MLRSMFTGISGLRNHQTRLDAVSNNIANVNTIGYKKGRVNFQDILNQTITGASAPTAAGVGGINSRQIGLGITLGSIDNIFSQGNLQFTGINTDMAIQGNGMFALSNGSVNRYIRAGIFTLDSQGTLVNAANGWNVRGWQADAGGVINTAVAPTNIAIPVGDMIPARATNTINYAYNLNALTNGALQWSNASPVFTDSATGDSATVSFTFTPTGNFNEWRWDAVSTSGTLSAATGTFTISDTTGQITAASHPTITLADPGNNANADVITIGMPNVGDNMNAGAQRIFAQAPDTNTPTMIPSFTSSSAHLASVSVYDSLGTAHNVLVTLSKTGNNSWSWVASGTGVTGGGGTLVFNPDGSLQNSTVIAPITLVVPPASNMNVTPDFSSVTQYASPNTVVALSQNGYVSGSLLSFNITDAGIVSGAYSNGISQNLAQIALAHFINYGGLQKEGDNMFAETVNSGTALIGTANAGGRGAISAGTLEMSNVDLSEEFTSMITAQRGFQANSRSITTSDEILQELLMLKR